MENKEQEEKGIFEGLDTLILSKDTDDIEFDPTKDYSENNKEKEVKEKETIEKIDPTKLEEENNQESVNNTEETILKAWGDEFKTNNILSDEDLKEFDGSFDGLVKAFHNREVRTGLEMVEDYKSQLPQELKMLAENWEEGVPLDELINIRSNQMRYSSINEKELDEKPETQKAVVAEYLRKTTKFSDAKIQKEIERLLELDELKGEARDGLKELKAFESEAEDILKKETKKQQERRREENSKVIREYEKTVKSIKEVIPGIKIDDKMAEKMLKYTIDPVGLDGYGNPVSYIQSLRQSDPYNFDLKLNYIMEVTKGLTDFSKISNTIKTSTNKEFMEKLDNPKTKTGKSGQSSDGKKSILDYLEMPINKRK